MNKNTVLFTSTAAGISLILSLLPAGTGTSMLFSVFAQSPTPEPISLDTAATDNNATEIRLGEPFFEERGKITGQEEIGDNKTQFTYSANGTMKGNINITNTGSFVSTPRGDNVTLGQGQGVIMTTDGNGTSEIATQEFQFIGNVTEEGKPVFHGSSIYNTNSTGKLAFLNDLMGIYRGELDEMGNFVVKEWEWK